MKLVERYWRFVPELLCFEEYSGRSYQYLARRSYLGCRLYANVRGSCRDFLERLAPLLQELVEEGASEFEELSYTRAAQLAQLLLISRIADDAEVVVNRVGRSKRYVVKLRRKTTADIPRTRLSKIQVASSILRVHIVDPSKPLTRLLIAWTNGVGPVVYEGLDPGDAYVLELLNNYFSRSMDRWSCIATPCSCRGFEMYSGGRGRISRGVITTFRALSIAALPVLLFILSGVAMATVRGVEMLHEIYENLSRSVREMFEDLYSAPLHQVAPVLKRCVDSLQEELDRERVIEILESSGVESLELTAYFMKVL